MDVHSGKIYLTTCQEAQQSPFYCHETSMNFADRTNGL